MSRHVLPRKVWFVNVVHQASPVLNLVSACHAEFAFAVHTDAVADHPWDMTGEARRVTAREFLRCPVEHVWRATLRIHGDGV